MNRSTPYCIRHLHGLKARVATALSLLILYLCGSLGVELAHQAMHADAAPELHSAIQENNPCHRSLFHNDVDKGCGHHSHLLKNDACKLCHLLFHTEQVVPKVVLKSRPPHVVIYLVKKDLPTLCEVSYSQSQRGPPQA